MTNNELLLAISSMLDPMREDIRELKEDVRGLEGRVQGLEGEIREVKGHVKRIEMTQEKVIVPRLEHIEACYTSTYDRYRVAVEEHNQMKEDISLLKQVVTRHSEKLQKIS